MLVLSPACRVRDLPAERPADTDRTAVAAG
jgi:hypothetical protein